MPPAYALVGDDDERFVVQPLDSEQAPAGESFLVAKRALSPEMQEQIRSEAAPLAAANGYEWPDIPPEGPIPPLVDPFIASTPDPAPLPPDLAAMALEPGAAGSEREALPVALPREVQNAAATLAAWDEANKPAPAPPPPEDVRARALAAGMSPDAANAAASLAAMGNAPELPEPLPPGSGITLAPVGVPPEPRRPRTGITLAPVAAQQPSPGSPTATDLFSLRASALLRGTGGTGGVGVPSARVAPLEETPDFTTEIKANEKPALAALDAQTAVEKKLIDQKTVLQRNHIAEVQNTEADYDGRLKAKQKRVDTMRAEVLAKRIDPNRFWNSQGAEGKVQSIIAIMLSGFGQGLQAAGGWRGAPNLAMEVLDRQIERDIEAQGADLRTRQTILGQEIDDLGDIRAAGMAAVARLKANFAAQYELAALEAGGQQADATNMAMAAKLRADSTALLQQAYARASQIKTGALKRQLIATMLPLDAALRQAEIRKANAATLAAQFDMASKLVGPVGGLPAPGVGGGGVGRPNPPAGIGYRVTQQWVEAQPLKERSLFVRLSDGTWGKAQSTDRAERAGVVESYANDLYPAIKRFKEMAAKHPHGFMTSLGRVGEWATDFEEMKSLTSEIQQKLSIIRLKGTGPISNYDDTKLSKSVPDATDFRPFSDFVGQQTDQLLSDLQRQVDETRFAFLGVPRPKKVDVTPSR